MGTVLIVDDHALVRAGIRLILSQLLDGAEVAEASDGRQAVDLARKLQPELCLLDLSMPGLNGIDAIPAIRAASPATRVLVVSMHVEREAVIEALRAGAQGYLVKDAAVEELADAIAELRRGRPFLSRRIAAELLSELAREGPGARNSPRALESVAQLSPRQREVLQLIAEGRSTRAIAERLHLSVKTVETHRAEIMRRLGIHDVAGLTRYAVRHGIVDAGH